MKPLYLERKHRSDTRPHLKPGSANAVTDAALEAAILDLLAARGNDKTICPSEAARAVASTDWKPLMQPVRDAARRLVAAGRIDILQNNRIVDGDTAKGPIRLKLRPA